jgi:hypothetical protein
MMKNWQEQSRGWFGFTLDGSPAAWARTYSQNQPQMARSTRCAVICFSTKTSLEPRTDPQNTSVFRANPAKGRTDPARKDGVLLLLGRENSRELRGGEGRLPGVGEEEDALQHSAPSRGRTRAGGEVL